MSASHVRMQACRRTAKKLATAIFTNSLQLVSCTCCLSLALNYIFASSCIYVCVYVMPECITAYMHDECCHLRLQRPSSCMFDGGDPRFSKCFCRDEHYADDVRA